MQIYNHNLIATKKNREKMILWHEELQKSVTSSSLIPIQEHQENKVIADLIWIYAEKSIIL
jgi:hypothetical protein